MQHSIEVYTTNPQRVKISSVKDSKWFSVPHKSAKHRSNACAFDNVNLKTVICNSPSEINWVTFGLCYIHVPTYQTQIYKRDGWNWDNWCEREREEKTCQWLIED